MKKPTLILSLLICISLICSGCSSGELVKNIIQNHVPEEAFLSSEAKKYNEAVDAFFAALDAGDSDAIRGLFSKNVQETDADLDQQIETLTALYSGPTDINRRDGKSLSGSYSNHYGDHTSTVYSTFPVVSNDIFYWCYFELTYENDEDEDNIGITKLLFFSADERCRFQYDGDWKIPDESGLIVYPDDSLDCEVRCVSGYPYKFTPSETPLKEDEVKSFLDTNTSFSAFVERFGEPNAVHIYHIYELPPVDDSPRYLQVSVDEYTNEIFGASAVDSFEWLYRVWEEPTSSTN